MARPEDLTELLNETLREAHAIAASRQISLIHPESPDSIFAFCDRKTVTQILRNLVEDAIRVSQPAGSVMLSVVELDLHALVSITEQPTAAPMPERSREGFNLAQKLLGKHGGRIWINRQKGKGAEVRLTLPLTKASVRSRA